VSHPKYGFFEKECIPVVQQFRYIFIDFDTFILSKAARKQETMRTLQQSVSVQDLEIR